MRSVFKRISAIFLFLTFFSSAVMAADSFTVQHIEIEGLQNITPSTVRSYIPIHEGQVFSYQQSGRTLQALYKTGFFYTVSLGRRGNNLIVIVKERPMITLVQVNGNKEISTEKIQPVLTKMNISPGNIYDPEKLNLFDQSLEEQYAMLGYAATSVHSEAKEMSHNRVAVEINVDEGTIVKVHSIDFVGNDSFSARTLRNQFKLKTTGIFTWFSHSDRFSRLKFEEDLEHLHNFYLDHGFVKFRIVSQQVDYTPDHKHVNITITISEGPKFRISGFQIVGQTLGYDAEIRKVVTFKEGDVFSRQQIIESQKAINNFFADKGYAFTQVSVMPNINDSNNTVFVTYNIVVGPRVYVRRINITGNSTTNEEVVRRELRQMEAAPYSLGAVNESKRRLMLTSYFSDVTVSTNPVPETNNQIDMNVDVKEQPSGKASLQGGWSSQAGFLYGASVTQPNFLGTGKYVGVGFTNSQVNQTYYFNYVNPYYTWYGVSRGFNVFYNRNRWSKSFGYTPYSMNSYGFDLNYGFPISERNSITVDFGYSRVDLSHLDVVNLAPSVTDFLNLTLADFTNSNVTRSYNATKIAASWSYSGLDRAVMPTKGVSNQLAFTAGVPIFSNSLSYYIVNDTFAGYLPLTHGFVLNFMSTFGYGRGNGSNNLLPFIYNFYAGGLGTVPGFASNTLGPKYYPGTTYGGSALGGNLLTTAGLHLILPQFINEQVRIALTLDAGNVFQAPVYQPDVNALWPRFAPPGSPQIPLVVQDDAFAFRNMRVSGGVMVTWYTPIFGPISVSLAYPLRKRFGDQLEPFQFAMGLSF